MPQLQTTALLRIIGIGVGQIVADFECSCELNACLYSLLSVANPHHKELIISGRRDHRFRQPNIVITGQTMANVAVTLAKGLTDLAKATATLANASNRVAKAAATLTNGTTRLANTAAMMANTSTRVAKATAILANAYLSRVCNHECSGDRDIAACLHSLLSD